MIFSGEHKLQYPGKELEAMSFTVNYHQWIVDEFSAYLGDQVAEVGAGIGSITSLLLDKGVSRLVSFEPSHNMFPRLADRLDHDPRVTLVNDVFYCRHTSWAFDTVIYLNVLEHIEDDRSEMKDVFEALKPGGYAVVFVPAFQWLYSELDRLIGHYRRYTKHELCEILEEAGFAIVEARYLDLMGVIPWMVYFVMMRKHMGGTSVKLYDRLVVPPMRRIETLMKPPLGKNILAVAQKPRIETTGNCLLPKVQLSP